MGDEQKREHFRIVYPMGQFAKILIKKVEYPVVDISQRGIKFALGRRGIVEDWDVGTQVKGSVSLLSGSKTIIVGKVLRVHEESSVILYLDKPIELKLMYDEHRFVIQKYGSE